MRTIHLLFLFSTYLLSITLAAPIASVPKHTPDGTAGHHLATRAAGSKWSSMDGLLPPIDGGAAGAKRSLREPETDEGAAGEERAVQEGGVHRVGERDGGGDVDGSRPGGFIGVEQ